MSPNPFFLISILLSALIAFSTVALIVEASLILLQRNAKFNNGRTRSFLRCLPFVSLAVDLLSKTFSIGYIFNPLNCQSCIQKLVLSVFFPELKTYLYTNEISLLRHLGEGISHTIFEGITIGLVALTLFFVFRKVAEAIFVSKMLRSTIRNGSLCSRSIHNASLNQALQKKGIKILVSNEIIIPAATYSNVILIPAAVHDHFSQEEFEAVLAHELEHILWKDPLIRFFSQLISVIFWWLPTYEFRKKLEFEQEIACDQSIVRYGIQEHFLASALLKVTTHAREKKFDILCYLTEKKHSSMRRLEAMLKTDTKSSKRFEWISFIVVILAAIIILLCALWT